MGAPSARARAPPVAMRRMQQSTAWCSLAQRTAARPAPTQLKRLGLLCGAIFALTALGADGVPPVLQPRAPAAAMEGLPPVPGTGYNYVVLHVFIVTVTRRCRKDGRACVRVRVCGTLCVCVHVRSSPMEAQPTLQRRGALARAWLCAPWPCRSVNMAITAAALTFTSLQAASLCLVTTPGEEMALALKWWLSPLRLIKAPVQARGASAAGAARGMRVGWGHACCSPVQAAPACASSGVLTGARARPQEIALTLLLSLRFMSLVFEEVRNLALGLAARGVNWQAQGGRGSLLMAGRLCVRLFANLFHRCVRVCASCAACVL